MIFLLVGVALAIAIIVLAVFVLVDDLPDEKDGEPIE